MKQLLAGGRVLSARRLDGRHLDVLIDRDRIVDLLEPGTSVGEDVRRVDASQRLLIPGLVNAHTHAAVQLGKGLADRWSLELLLNAYPWTAGGRTLEDKYLSAYIGAVEMVRKGCTACYDLFAEMPVPSVEGMETVARAYEDVGMRAVIAPMMADRSFYQAIPGLLEAMPPVLRERAEAIRLQPGEASLATCRTILERWSWDRDRVRPALAPTIPHHCTDDFIIGCRDLARDAQIPVQMHVAESKVQAVVGVKRYRTTLVGHLQKLGLLAPNFTAAHAIWLDDEDFRRLADSGATVAHNPASNLKLGSGVAATPLMRKHGICFGLGTDGCLSNDNLNMFEAMRLAAYGSRIQGGGPDEWLAAEEVFKAATVGGARALGFDGEIGQLEPGYKADLVFLDLTNINYVPVNDPLLNVVFCEDGTGIDRVMIGGRIVVEGGRVLGVDMPGLAKAAAETVERLARTNAATRQLMDTFAPVIGAYCLGLAREPYLVHRWCGHDER